MAGFEGRNRTGGGPSNRRLPERRSGTLDSPVKAMPLAVNPYLTQGFSDRPTFHSRVTSPAGWESLAAQR
jgi:hypothetical protein